MTKNGNAIAMSLAIAAHLGAASIAEVPDSGTAASSSVDSGAGRARGIALPASPASTAIERIPVLAIASIGGTDVEADELEEIADRLEADVARTGRSRVLPRGEFDRVLRRKGLRASGACEEERCMAELGRLLGVDGVVSIELGREDEERWLLSVRQVDVASNSVVFRHDLVVRGSLRDVRRTGCRRIAEMLAGKRNPGSNRTIVAGPGFLDWPWIVGGVVVAGGLVATAILLTRDEPSEPERRTVGSEQTVVRW